MSTVAAYKNNRFSRPYFHHFYIHLAEMGISAHVVESVRNVDAIAVTAVPFSHCHGAVSGGIYRSPCVSGKVEAFMEFADSVNRVASVSVARSHLLHVFL